jgi:hypothetical protein
LVQAGTAIASAIALPVHHVEQYHERHSRAVTDSRTHMMPGGAALWALSILIYATATLFLLIKTGRDFKRYAQKRLTARECIASTRCIA